MWFATQDGISRFDGKSFINLNSYNVDKKRKIIGTDVYDIKPDLSGNFLWVLSAYGGLSKIDLTTCNVIATYEIKQTVKPGTTLWYKCMFENDKFLVIGINEGIICCFNKLTGRTENSFSLAERFNCTGTLERLFIDNHNRVWFFISGTGILITDPTLTQKISIIKSSQIDQKQFLFTDYASFNNQLFVTTNDGLRLIDIENLKVVSNKNIQQDYLSLCNNKELHSVSITTNYAVVTGKNLVYKINLNSGKTERVLLAGNFEDQSWTTLNNSVYADNQSIWLGSQYGVGLIRNINSAFVSYFNSSDGNNIKIKHATAISAVSDSNIFVCADDDLYDLNPNNGTIKKFGVEDFYFSVFSVTRGYYIATGVSKGMQLLNLEFKPINISTVFPELNSIKNDLIMSSAKLGDSVIFMASQNKNGLYIWNTAKKEVKIISTKTAPLSLKNDNINRLFIDSKKRLWVVSENAIAIYDYFKNTMFHVPLTDPSTKTPISINMDVCETAGSYWIASYGTGIIELSKNYTIKNIYGAKDGIKNLGFYRIFNINDSLLIASSNNGLITININKQTAKSYFFEDGLQSNSFEEGCGDKMENTIFFGGINGITKINSLKLISSVSSPILTFSSILLVSQNKMKDTLNINLQKLTVPQDVSQVNINFSAINYEEPEKVRFSYKIIENDKEWNTTDKNSIQFFPLSPGKYHLQVQAFNEDGLPSQVKELTLIFLPKWYQTLLFKILVGLFIAGFIYALYRYRIEQVRKQERMRKQISADLHDDIGGTLSSINVFSHLAISNPGKLEYLVNINEGTQAAVMGVRDIVWVLDDRLDTVSDLVNRFMQFARPLATANKILLEQKIDPQLLHHPLSKNEKRNIYLILKEAFNNCIKYSGCNNFSYTMEVVNSKKIRVIIKDNGRGFEISKSQTGNGLKNMQDRSAQIGYEYIIESSENAGTTIQLIKR